MCCRTAYDGKKYKPGDQIPVRSAVKRGEGKWAGFARSETAELTWRNFDVMLDVLAEEYAENNAHLTQQEGHTVRTWGRIDEDRRIYAIGNRLTGEVKVLTREATPDELRFFGHGRMPVIGPARF